MRQRSLTRTLKQLSRQFLKLPKTNTSKTTEMSMNFCRNYTSNIILIFSQGLKLTVVRANLPLKPTPKESVVESKLEPN